MSLSKILQQINQNKIKWIRLQFCNPFGLLHQLSIPAEEINKESLVNGFPLDGSSIVGFSNIESSDVVLVPEPSTFAVLPDFFDIDHREQNHYVSKSARMFANVHEGFGGGQLAQDSRHMASEAEKFAKKSGFAKTFWAAELEFFVFDRVDSSKNHENIVSIIDMERPPAPTNYEDVYIVHELMDSDLYKLIYSKQ